MSGPAESWRLSYRKAVRSDKINAVNRRRFLLSAAAAAASLAARTRSLRKAIMYDTIHLDMAVRAKFMAVKEAGFAGIEPMSHMTQSEVLDAFGASGLQAASVCCATHWKNPLS